MDSTFSQPLAETQKFHFKKFSGGVGLGWQIREPVERLTIHWHNGGTGGYVSFIGFDKNNKVGVVVLSNHGDAWSGDSFVDKIGLKLLKIGSKISLE
jgi:serine-type D-Ala-D-Ala carboxypeptidase/endopeptidase